MSHQLFIFEANKQDGIISCNKKFYEQQMTQEQISEQFLQTRIKLGNKYNFNGKRIVQALQKNQINGVQYRDGKYTNINEIKFNQADLWYEKIPTDILIITKDNPGIVIGNQMADCPILIIEDKKLGVTALSHCGAVYINRELPKQTVAALIAEFKSNPKNIHAYISSCAHQQSYVYETYPTWATNSELWKGFIFQRSSKYHINLVGAITKQLQEMNIHTIKTSSIDTIKDKDFASHYAFIHGDDSKIGQNFVGCFYK